MISVKSLADVPPFALPESNLVLIEQLADVRLKFSPFEPKDIPARVLQIASFAFSWFFQPSCYQKIYLSSSGEIAYGKKGPVGKEDRPTLALPHSLRKLHSSSFILTLDRKEPSTLLGEGSYKKVKKGWLVDFDASYRISIKTIACGKDMRAAEHRFFINYLDLLDKDSKGIESQAIYFHETSNRTYKKFHHSPLALCDAFELTRLPKPPNFTELISIFLDLSKGVKHLLECNLVHGDLKPENILIYYEDGKYSGKFCDLSSIGNVGGRLKEQNLKYLSPVHKSFLFGKIVETVLNPSAEQIRVAYSSYLKLNSLRLSPETMLQSLGIVFADIVLSSKNAKGDPDEIELFWAMISELTGFRPDSETVTSTQFHQKIDAKILELAQRRTPSPMTTITISRLIETLTYLASKKRSILIPLETTLETPKDFIMRIEGGRHPKKALEFESILPQILKLFKHATPSFTKKIYFNELEAYTKQRSGLDNPHFPHSIKSLGEGRWIVILDRKSKTTLEMQDSSLKKKYGWEIISTHPNQFIAQESLICTDIHANTESCDRMAMERLHDLSCVECPGERILFKTSLDFFKKLHIAPPSGVTSSHFFQIERDLPFPQFIKICADTLTGIAQLHENDLIYGNLRLNKIVIFNNPVSGEYSAKISASPSCIPSGNISSQSTLDYLSPRIRHFINTEVSKTLHDPTTDQIRKKYHENPSSFNIIISPEDETATAGIMLSELAVFMKKTLASVTSETRDQFWDIISNLTGGFIPGTSLETGMNFFQDLAKKIADFSSRGGPPAPTISLRGAAARLRSLCP